MRFEASYMYRTRYIEVSEPEESWSFASFIAAYNTDCATEIVVPVFAANNTELDITSYTAIRFDSATGLIYVQTDNLLHINTYPIALKFKSSTIPAISASTFNIIIKERCVINPVATLKQ